MCENCEKVKEEAWAEIRDLLNFNRKVNGPLSEQMKVAVENAKENGVYPDEFGENMVEAVRAEMIAERCVIIARACEGSMFHMEPLHLIAGAWAGELLKKEMALAYHSLFGGWMKGEDDE